MKFTSFFFNKSANELAQWQNNMLSHITEHAQNNGWIVNTIQCETPSDGLILSLTGSSGRHLTNIQLNNGHAYLVTKDYHNRASLSTGPWLVNVIDHALFAGIRTPTLLLNTLNDHVKADVSVSEVKIDNT